MPGARDRAGIVSSAGLRPAGAAGVITLLGLLGTFAGVEVAFAAGAAASAAATSGGGGPSAAGQGAAALAAANVGKSAGTCADRPSENSLGGAAYDGSCAGDDGKPEYWCADFAMWVWQNSGLPSTGLTAGAGSFYVYGQSNGTLHTSTSYVPQPGDAVVYDYNGNDYADHVAIVTAVNADGSVVTANGDWNGAANAAESAFATSSAVVSVTIPAGQRAVGTIPTTVDPGDHYRISAYVTPVGDGSGSNPTPGPANNPYSPASVCGAGYSVVDSHSLDSSTIYLLYDAATGDNCVTTLADNPSGPVALNATLSVQGGASAANPGRFGYYAGPVTQYAPSSCVEWGGSDPGTSWTSGWSHCS
jgi:hypothetical protein